VSRCGATVVVMPWGHNGQGRPELPEERELREIKEEMQARSHEIEVELALRERRRIRGKYPALQLNSTLEVAHSLTRSCTLRSTHSTIHPSTPRNGDSARPAFHLIDRLLKFPCWHHRGS
jgi:hypothetical protein